MTGRARQRYEWLRHFAKLWGFALFLVFVLVVFRRVVLPFVFAALLAYLLAPVVRRLNQMGVFGRRISRGTAVVGVYVGVLSILALFLAYVVPRLTADLSRLVREAPALYSQVQLDYVPRLGRWLDTVTGLAGAPRGAAGTPVLVPQSPASPGGGDGAARAAPPGPHVLVTRLADGRYAVALDQLRLDVSGRGQRWTVAAAQHGSGTGHARFEESLRAWVVELFHTSRSEAAGVLRVGQRFVTGVVRGCATFVLVLMIAAFILIDLQRVQAFIRSLVPMAYRVHFDNIATGVDAGLGGVIRGQLLICAINGALTYFGLLIFSVKYALVLGLIASVMSVVPIFGSILSSLPIVAVALVSGTSGVDPWKAMAVLSWIVFIHLVEANFLNPKIIGSAAKMHPVVVIFALMAGETSYGLVGALLAVPVASMIQTLFLYFRSRAWSPGWRDRSGG
jgi:predicted PurR-regulated permease PerM